MKNILKSSIVLLIGVVTACDVVELDQLNATDSDNGQQLTEDELQGPSTVPTSADEVLNLLHGGTDKIWEAEGFTIFGMSGFLPCRLDDRMILSPDGSYSYDGGSSLCGAEDNARVKAGTWELSEDLSTISFTEGPFTHTAELLGLSEDQITLRGDYQGLELNAVYTSN